MARAAPKHITTAPTVDPVVGLSREILRIWDAESGAEQAFRGDPSKSMDKADIAAQLGEFRDALETLISFSSASGLEGALVQLALALDTLNGISTSRDSEDELNVIELKLNRMIRSAMDVMRSALRAEIDPTVRSIVRIYAGNPEKITKWIDRVDDWAENGRTRRLQEDEGS